MKAYELKSTEKKIICFDVYIANFFFSEIIFKKKKGNFSEGKNNFIIIKGTKLTLKQK